MLSRSLFKTKQTNEAEIMQTVFEEARASYPQEIVVELKSEESDDLEANVARIVEWIKSWIQDRNPT